MEYIQFLRDFLLGFGLYLLILKPFIRWSLKKIQGKK